MPNNSGKTRFLRYLGYCAYLLATIILADYLFFAIYMAKIRPAELSKAKLSKIESLVYDLNCGHKSCFQNFPEKKKPGTIRIGCFGDSFTSGDEVNDTLDYPRLLEEIFKRNGYANVEVLNFGNGWHGFHQAFMLWEYAGKKYGLDYVILGPACFQFDRDSKFNHTFEEDYNRGNAGYIHARYILTDDGVQLEEPIGKNHAEIFRHYWRFIPHARYLRFNNEAPLFLAAPVACLTPNRKLRSNPFYYKRDLEREMIAIDKILLSRIADNVPQVILCNYDPRVVRFAQELHKTNLFTLLLDKPSKFPYLAFGGHNSPEGNMLLAEILFDCLTGKTESVSCILETKDIAPELTAQALIKKERVCAYKQIAIETNGVKIGRFYNSDVPNWTVHCYDRQCEPKIDPLLNTTALVALKENNMSLLDAVFLPAAFELEDKMPVILKVKGKTGTRNYRLGEMRLLNPGLNIGVIDLDSLLFCSAGQITGNKAELRQAQSLTLLLKDRPLCSLRPGTCDIRSECLSSRHFFIRADGREIVDIQKLPAQGIIYLSLETKQLTSIKLPIAQWIKSEQKQLLLHGQSCGKKL